MNFLSDEDIKIAEQNGISYKNAFNRVYYNGWSVEDAITRPLYKPNLWTIWKDVAKENGIAQETFYKRMKLSDMSPEQAATTPIRMKQQGYYGGRVTPEMAKKAEENGISRNTLNTRIYRYNWSPEDAVNIPLQNRKQKRLSKQEMKLKEQFEKDEW